MDGMLVEPLAVIAAVSDPAVSAVRLLAENDQLRADVERERRQNLELRQQAGYWQSMHARATLRLDEVQ